MVETLLRADSIEDGLEHEQENGTDDCDKYDD